MDRKDIEGEIVPVPERGRVFRRGQEVRLADVSPGGRLRLDAFARYLQDVSNDDARDSGIPDPMAWVVRRMVIEVRQFAIFGEVLELATFCSGIGSRWAERGVSAVGDRGAVMNAATLWVHLDLDTMTPKRLPADFEKVYGEAAGGRTVRSRLVHDAPPSGAVSTRWPVRFADFDLLDHMNNAAYWVPVEELLAAHRDRRAPMRAELEYRAPVAVGHDLGLVVVDDEKLRAWLVSEAGVHSSVVVESLP
jgi:acyl-ACP thioesterase